MKRIFTYALLLVFMLLPTLPGTVHAAGECSDENGKAITANSSKDQVLEGVEKTGNKCDGTSVASTLGVIINILSLIAGIVAVIMMIIAGLKYITSGGDPNKVGAAKQTLIYVVVGLIVAALAQALVYFVVNTSVSASTPCGSNQKLTQGSDMCVQSNPCPKQGGVAIGDKDCVSYHRCSDTQPDITRSDRKCKA